MLDMQSMGQRIRALRKYKELTQVALAKHLGIDQSTLSDIERDANDSFSGKVLLRMAEVLERSPFFIVYGIEADAGTLTAEEAELVMLYRAANKDQRLALLAMARALVASRASPDQ